MIYDLIITEYNQLEDPRTEWRNKQELMLKEYLCHANSDLQVFFIPDVFLP